MAPSRAAGPRRRPRSPIAAPCPRSPAMKACAACVACGILIGALPAERTGQLLYAAQVALSALPRDPKPVRIPWPPTPYLKPHCNGSNYSKFHKSISLSDLILDRCGLKSWQNPAKPNGIPKGKAGRRGESAPLPRTRAAPAADRQLLKRRRAATSCERTLPKTSLRDANARLRYHCIQSPVTR